MKINELRDSKGKLPAYAWPGGYPIFYVVDDGESLCPECVNDPSNPVHEDAPNDGWRIVGYDINYEDAQLYCAHCNKCIESAYAEEEVSK